MDLVARVLRFSQRNPAIYVPLLVFWAVQACAATVCSVMPSELCAGMEVGVGFLRLTFPLFMAATAALIMEGLNLGRARGRHLARHTWNLILRASLPWAALLILAQAGWQMRSWAGAAFFLGNFLIFTFLPEAMSLEKSLNKALERSMGLLEAHPVACLCAAGGGLLLAGLSYLAGVWHFESGGGFDVHMPNMTSPVWIPFLIAGVALMLCRTLIYREISPDEAVGIESGW